MLSNNQCPECRKILTDGRNRCTCGWFGMSQAKPVSPYQCQHIEDGIRCEYMGTSSNRIKGNYWYCRKHANSEK